MPNLKRMWIATSCATVATMGGTIITDGNIPIVGRAVFAQAAPAVETLPAAPVAVAPGNASADSWLTYKGDLQRTGMRAMNLQLPLNLLWRHSTEAAPNTVTAPLITGPLSSRRVYFAAGPAIYCVDGQTGDQIWRSEVLTKPVTAPISLISGENGDMILAVTSSGQMSALRTTDGGQLWEADARSPVQTAAPILANTAQGERIIVGIALGRLLAFTREGALDPKWEVRLGRQGAAPTSTPALSADGKFLFLTAQDGKLYCIDVMRGQIHYSVQLSTTALSSPLVLEDQVVVAAGSVVSGYKIKTGDPIWRTQTNVRQITASPAGGLGPQNAPIVYIGAKDGIFFAIDAKRGTVLWKTDLKESVTGTAVVLNNIIMVGTGRGVLYGINPADGTTQWQYRLHTERDVAARPNRNQGGEGGFPEGGFPGGEFGGGSSGGGSSSGSASSGESGSGFPGGEFGAGAATSPAATTPAIRTFGVTSPPAVVNGQVFLLGDNAALYAFDMMPFDAVPPRAVEPSLSVPARPNGLKTELIAADKPLIIPGKAPVYFAVELDDTGSGIDPASIRVTANNEEVPKERTNFYPHNGILTVTLTKSRAGNVPAVNLPDGLLAITVTAKDYNGNALNYNGSVTIDNALRSPSREPAPPPGFGFPGGYPGGGGSSSSGGFAPP